MSLVINDVRSKLNDLGRRAKKHMQNPHLRNQATPEQIKLYNENCDDLSLEQFENINNKK